MISKLFKKLRSRSRNRLELPGRDLDAECFHFPDRNIWRQRWD